MQKGMGGAGDLSIKHFRGDRPMNCAQSVFLAFAEKYGLDEDMASAVASCLGGGFCSGEVCGALSGAVLVIGLRHGRGEGGYQEYKETCRARTREFVEAFRKEHGSILCRELLDIGDGIPARRELCEGLVRFSAELLEKLGY